MLPLKEEKMKTTKILLSVLLSIVFVLIVCPAFAAENNSTVYASPEEQEYVYCCATKESFDLYKMLSNNHLSIIKDTITTVYTMDLLDYAHNNTLEITPYLIHCGGALASQVYTAKVVTSENKFAGNLLLYVSEGTAHSLGFYPSEELKEYFEGVEKPIFNASCSYADHASRIAKVLGVDSIIQPECVKYMSISGIGDCFFIQYEGNKYLIPVGYVNSRYEITDAVLTETDLREAALQCETEYNKYMDDKAAWEIDHPGEEYSPICSSGVGSTVLCNCGHLDNIIDVKAYFSNQKDSTMRRLGSSLCWILGLLAIVLMSALLIVGMKLIIQKKAFKRTSNTD